MLDSIPQPRPYTHLTFVYPPEKRTYFDTSHPTFNVERRMRGRINIPMPTNEVSFDSNCKKS